MKDEFIELLQYGLDTVATIWAMSSFIIGLFILFILYPIWALPYYLWKHKKE
jgi:hypothetical protein